MEEEFVEAALDTLPADDLLHIMKQITPESVIKLCQVNKKFGEFCRDDFVWSELIKEHFPLFNATSTPKEQYKALVNKIFTYYIITSERSYNIQVIDTQDNAIYIFPMGEEAIIGEAEEENVGFKIRGLPFENDTYMWITLYDDYRYNKDQTEVFRTKDEAINHIMDTYYEDLLDDMRIYADQEFGAVNNGTVNQAAEEHSLPIPFNIDNVRNYLDLNKLMYNIPLEDPLPVPSLPGLWIIKRILFKVR